MGNIQEIETHYTFHSGVGNIGDSFFYLPHWYKNNYLLLTLVQGKSPAGNGPWLEYLEKRGIKFELMGEACLVMPESVEQIFLDERTFHGESEVYVCHKKPQPDSVPANSYPTSSFNFDDGVPSGFSDGLKALDALLYMSEGSGVNIAHKLKEEIIYFVREMSMP